MPTTLIYGGHGKVALHLTSLLAKSSSYKIINVIRNQDHAIEIESIGGTPLVQSIEDASVETMAESLKSHQVDSVVWSAGAGGKGADRTEKVDRDGAIKSMDACAMAGVKRFVMVSAIDVRDRNKSAPSWYNDDDKKASDKGWGAIGSYMAAKLAADKNLVENNSRRKLDYTIVRPATLGEGDGTSRVDVGHVRLGQKIPRMDVARVLAEVLKNDGTIGLAFDLVEGETPVEAAVKKVVDEKINTFEGNY